MASADPKKPNTESKKTTDDSIFKDEDHGSNLSKGFVSLYESQHFTDFIVCADGREFSCHKNVLAATSPYFKGLLLSGMAESKQDRVVLKDITSESLQTVIEYMYKGEVVLTVESVEDVLWTSNFLQIIRLRDGCAKFMSSRLTAANCIGMYYFGYAHGCCELYKKAKKVICDKFAMLRKEREFLKLPIEKFLERMVDNKILVPDEIHFYETCVEWLNYDLGSRKQYINKVMSLVRFANISSCYFYDNIEPSTLWDECSDFKGTMKEVRCYHMVKNRQLELNLNYMPRRGMSFKRIVLIVGNRFCKNMNGKPTLVEGLSFKQWQIWDVRSSQDHNTIIMPGCCVAGDNLVYIAGGAVIQRYGPQNPDFINELTVFDPMSGSLQQKAKMKQNRCQFSLVVLDRYMYAVGGMNGRRISLLAIVERYDFQCNCWTTVAPLPEPLRLTVGVGFKSKLYVFGGENKDGIVKSSLRYDPVVDQWTSLADMSVPRALAAAVVHKGEIYVIGGCIAFSNRGKLISKHCTNKVEILNPLDGSWTEGPSIPVPMFGAGVVKYNNNIMVVGGEGDNGYLNDAVYSLADDYIGKKQWIIRKENVPADMRFSSCGVIMANMPVDVSGFEP